MKTALCAFALTVTSSAAFAAATPAHSCQAYAEKVAVNQMNKELASEVKTERPIEDGEKAQVTETVFVDPKGESSTEDSGIYQVQMSVMEECLDALIVKTKVVEKNGELRCEVIDVKAPDFGRDCG